MVRSVLRSPLRPALRPALRPTGAVLALLVAGGALAACSDNTPFGRNNTASNATKLAVPSTLTPPVQVGRISGAPDGWRMGEKVAEALRQRDIPAGTAKQGDSAYVLRGQVRRTGNNGKSSQVNVTWSLYDSKGKKVGEVTQVAAVPKEAMRKPNDDIVEAIADAAAESISPIVPSTRIDVADNVTTGEPEDKSASRAPKKKVTALGKQKETNSGISRNFTAHAEDKDAKKAADGKISLPRPLVRRSGDGKKRVNAIGKIDDGPSALSRNLAKGLNPAAGGDKKPSRPDARPPELADPDRAPKVAFKQRVKPAKVQRNAKPKQVADAPDVTAKPTAKGRIPRPVVTEFYPAAPKARRQATAPKPAPRTEPPARRAAAVVKIPPRPKAGNPKARQTAETRTERPAPRKTTPKQVAKSPEATSPATGPRATGKYVFWVQVGSYRTPELSAAKWTQTRDRAPALLSDVAHRIDRARVGNRGIWHRIQVGPYASKSQALSKCQRLKAAKVDCFILPERAGPGANPISALPPAKPSTAAARPAAPKVTVVTNDTGSAPKAEPKAGRRTATRPDRRPATRNYPLATSPGLPGLIP